MDKSRVEYMLEALKITNHPDDFHFRAALRRELAIELKLTPPIPVEKNESKLEKELEITEKHFNNACEQNENLKEAIRLISETF